jgi:hypothetical protein
VKTSIFLLAAIGLAPAANCEEDAAPLPGAKNLEVRSVDDVKAFFMRGIPKRSRANKGASHKSTTELPKHNRIYTVKELVAQFGDPEDRHRRRGTGETGEARTYRCKDGACLVQFSTRGYAGSTDQAAENLGLEIDGVSINTDGPPAAGKKGLK